jgi:threonine/homoserine/homoserine lactone efflux protein
MTPGLDFAIVTRNTLHGGITCGLRTTVGVAIGLCMHLLLTFMVLTGVVQAQTSIVHLIMLLGGGYLLYIGISSIQSSQRPVEARGASSPAPRFAKYQHPVFQGLLTNVLNPKVSLLSISLFAAYLDTHAMASIWWVFGIILVISTGWFVLLSMVWGLPWVKGMYARYRSTIELFVGVAFILLALEIFWTLGQSLTI